MSSLSIGAKQLDISNMAKKALEGKFVGQVGFGTTKQLKSEKQSLPNLVKGSFVPSFIGEKL